MAHLPMCVLQEEQKKMVSLNIISFSYLAVIYFMFMFCVAVPLGVLPVSTLLIGYYHGLLLRDTNADSLIDDLYSTGLLTAHEQNVILSGHSFNHRNWLLLEYVRHMDSQALLAFSELVKDVWPQIGLQLVTGTYVRMYYVHALCV